MSNENTNTVARNEMSNDLSALKSLTKRLESAGMNNELVNSLSKADVSLSQLAADTTNTDGNFFASNNIDVLDAIEQHDVQYGKLYEYLQRTQAVATPQQKITNALIMAYIHTHILNPETSEYGLRETGLPNSLTSVSGAQYADVPAQSKFMNVLQSLVHSQFKTNFNQMHQDAELRLSFVEGNSRMLKQTSEQQHMTISLLTQLSDYVNEQVSEYSAVYDKLSTLIDTQKRKSTFQSADVQTMTRWSYWCNVAFWIAVCVILLMVVVDKFDYIEKATAATTHMA